MISFQTLNYVLINEGCPICLIFRSLSARLISPNRRAVPTPDKTPPRIVRAPRGSGRCHPGPAQSRAEPRRSPGLSPALAVPRAPRRGPPARREEAKKEAEVPRSAGRSGGRRPRGKGSLRVSRSGSTLTRSSIAIKSPHDVSLTPPALSLITCNSCSNVCRHMGARRMHIVNMN